MDDRDIVAAMRASALTTLAGLAGAYDKYAALLYSYCCWLLGDSAVAAEVVRDTLLLAMTDLRGIRDPELVRAHLYAVARDECHQRLSSAASRRLLADGRRAGLRGLIIGTVARLDDREREVVELVFIHGLSPAGLALVLGVPQRTASTLAAKVQSYLERNLAVPIVAYAGTQACPKLNELLPEWGGHLDLWQRAEVESHIEECLTCMNLRYQAFHPAIVYALESPAHLPADLRGEVIRLGMDDAGLERTANREMSAAAADRGRLGTLLAVAAVAVWVVAAVSVAMLTIIGSHSSHGATVRNSRPPLTAPGPIRPHP
jgi:DNA-directed RNA polymerase specialized sigma24 family protein